uniref:Uncharacterized protein n=1 Tax=Cacopsylla melanoneura TaxID=428564 RepID=A0A8D8WCF7_9HEMI
MLFRLLRFLGAVSVIHLLVSCFFSPSYSFFSSHFLFLLFKFIPFSSSPSPPPSPPLPIGSSSTVHPPHHRKEKHSRKNQLSTEILIKEESVSSEQYESFYPSSAIIVFTFGLFLSVTMTILLCCRLKMIRRRLRKGGKSAYAHDADFLVNGMYL